MLGGKGDTKLIPSTNQSRDGLGSIDLFVAYPLGFGSRVTKVKLISTPKRVGGRALHLSCGLILLSLLTLHCFCD